MSYLFLKSFFHLLHKVSYLKIQRQRVFSCSKIKRGKIFQWHIALKKDTRDEITGEWKREMNSQEISVIDKYRKLVIKEKLKLQIIFPLFLFSKRNLLNPILLEKFFSGQFVCKYGKFYCAAFCWPLNLCFLVKAKASMVGIFWQFRSICRFVCIRKNRWLRSIQEFYLFPWCIKYHLAFV